VLHYMYQSYIMCINRRDIFDHFDEKILMTLVLLQTMIKRISAKWFSIVMNKRKCWKLIQYSSSISIKMTFIFWRQNLSRLGQGLYNNIDRVHHFMFQNQYLFPILQHNWIETRLFQDINIRIGPTQAWVHF